MANKAMFTNIETYSLADIPGELKYISKNVLELDLEYQRSSSKHKIKNIAKHWSPIACGVLKVARRLDDTYYVIDGGHRLAAARQRDDVTLLPCIVFDTLSRKDEAIGFCNTNCNRTTPNAIDKHRAALVAESSTAKYIQQFLDSHKISIVKNAKKHGELKAIARCYYMARENAHRFESTILLTNEICKDTYMRMELLDGIFYLSKKLQGGIEDDRFRQRLINIGESALLKAILDARMYFGTTGGKISASGIIHIANKGLQNKFILKP